MNQNEPIGSSQIKSVLALQDLLRESEMNIDSDWAVIAREIDDSIPPALEQIGRAGPWKSLTAGRCPRHVFEVPLCIVDQLAEVTTFAGARFDGLTRLVGWASSTFAGGAPCDWIAPSDHEIAALLPREHLTVQCAEIAIQGRIIRTDHRLAIQFPILDQIPPSLPAGRRKLLMDLLQDGHNSLRMVRAGVIGTEGRSQSALAEIDLTGAPPHAIQPLLRYSVDALHHAIRWSSGSAALIESERSCGILDL